MKYMLIMNSPKDGYDQYMKWPQKILEANIAFMQQFAKKLSDAGELVMTAGLAGPDQAKKVKAGERRQADHRWCVRRVEGVPGGLRDRGRRETAHCGLQDGEYAGAELSAHEGCETG